MNTRTKLSSVGKSIFGTEVLNISRHGFWLGVSGQEYFLPFDHFPWFREATIRAILNVELPHPSHLYWPDLDVDLEIESLQRPEKYPLVYRQMLNQPPSVDRKKRRGRSSIA